MIDLLKMFTDNALFALVVPGIFFGVLMLLASAFIPDIFKQYKIPAQLTGIFLVLFFTYQGGRYSEYTTWKTKELELAAEIALYKSKSSEITVTTVTKYVDRIKEVEKIKEVPIYVYVPSKADAACIIDDATSDSIRLLFNSTIKGKFPQTP